MTEQRSPSEHHSRRAFTLATLGFLGTVLNVACGGTPAPSVPSTPGVEPVRVPPPPTAEPIRAQPTPTNAVGVLKPVPSFVEPTRPLGEKIKPMTDLLVEAVDRLPPSDIKSMLQTRALPHYTSPNPRYRRYGDQDMLILPGITQFQQLANTVSREFVGTATLDLRGNAPDPKLQPMLLVTKDQQVTLPYMFLRLPHDTMPQSSDGTGLLPVVYRQGIDIYEGLQYRLTLAHNYQPGLVREEVLSQLERLSVLKALMQTALYDTWIQASADELKRLGLPGQIQVRQLNGIVRDAEHVSQTVSKLFSTSNRLNATMNAASFMLITKSVQGSDLEIPNKSKHEPGVVEAMQRVPIQGRAIDILKQSCEWVLKAPPENLPRLAPNSGDFMKAP